MKITLTGECAICSPCGEPQMMHKKSMPFRGLIASEAQRKEWILDGTRQ